MPGPIDALKALMPTTRSGKSPDQMIADNPFMGAMNVESVDDWSPMGGTVNPAGGQGGIAGLRALLAAIKDGAKKDPLKVFAGEKLGGPRVPAPTPVVPPKGFTLPPGMTPARAPALTEKAATQEKVYSQFTAVGKARPNSMQRATSLEDVQAAGKGLAKAWTPPPLLRKTLVSGPERAARKAKLTPEVVETSMEIIKANPDLNTGELARLLKVKFPDSTEDALKARARDFRIKMGKK